ncbi:hypothetical protein [Anoxynatronum sibiricum]|uniref:DUF927 domain-containing protein n=1 Tax=Anoxynatronum sibiricum TaxID=210623 RepID=A0ABU9VX56_9CLOT
MTKTDENFAIIRTPSENQDKQNVINPITFLNNHQGTEGLIKPITFLNNHQGTEGLIKPISFVGKNQENRSSNNLANPLQEGIADKQRKIRPITIEMNVPNLSTVPKEEKPTSEITPASKERTASSHHVTGIVKSFDNNETFSFKYQPLIEENYKLFIHQNKLAIEFNHEVQHLSNFAIEILEELVKNNGVSEERELLVRVTIGNEVILKQVALGDLSSPLFLKKVSDQRACLYKGPGFSKYVELFISHQIRCAPKRREYAFVGWTKIDNQNCYLHGGGAIGLNRADIFGDQSKRIEQDISSINPHEALAKTMELLNVYNDLSITSTLFLYRHLGVLKSLFLEAGFAPSFVLWLNGTTGSAKTTLSKLFFNIFNSSKEYIPSTFKDTKAAIEKKCFDHKDSVLLIDDLHPTTSRADQKKMEELANHIARLYGDSITKSRMTSQMEQQKEFPPRGLAVLTGEYTVAGDSTMARYIGTEIHKANVNFDLLTDLQRNTLYLSTHTCYFLHYVASNYDTIVTNLRRVFPSIRTELRNLHVHNRHIDAAACLVITSQILESYVHSIGKANHFFSPAQWKELILKTIELHSKKMYDENPGVMYLKAINMSLHTGKYKLLDLKNKHLASQDKPSLYCDDQYYYVHPEIGHHIAVHFWKDQGISYPVTKNGSFAHLDALGVLKKDADGKRAVKCSIPMGTVDRPRYLMIERKAMEKVLMSND